VTGKRRKSPKRPGSDNTLDGAPAAGSAGFEGAGPSRALRKRVIWIVASTIAVIVLLTGLGFHFLNPATPPGTSAAEFVGSETCAGCHRSEANLWRHSQHRGGMAHASKETVLGDFNEAGFDYYGVHSRFFREDGKFFVETDGPDGKLAVFEVKYTFGLDPLQQYLIEFPDGRVQALSIAWDSRTKEEGGQRWFHLYQGEEIKHGDALHWTRLGQNWNYMCAGCHSTGVHKNYDAEHDRFSTRWAEISVGCEACHGQGSGHLAWARDQSSWLPWRRYDDTTKGLLVRFDERASVVWRGDPATGNSRRNFLPARLRKEVETCGLCHARRGEFSEEWIPGRSLSDTHVVSTLSRGLYHADGEMRDEVYNYGSFKQSKMFAAGVTCSDCHEPHAAKLRMPGDGVCLQCHSPGKYQEAAHHHHAHVDPPLGCASCHMRASNYMVIDRRHDHGFRVPRPDLSTKLNTPNACNDCHADKPAEWAAAAIESWHGSSRKGFQSYAKAFYAAWTDQSEADALLSAVVSDGNAPAFARAGALRELASRPTPGSIKLARDAASDPDPMVRVAAVDVLANLPPGQLWPLLSPLLSDSNRGVRLRAVALLAAVPDESQPGADRERFEHAAAEFIAAQRLNADRPEARATLGNFFARRGRSREAEQEYKAALRLNPQFAPAAINLADLYRQNKRDDEGEAVLRAALIASPNDAGLHHAFGLALTRLKRPEEALAALLRASELAPDAARYAYVYAVALNSAGRNAEAVAALKDNLARHPRDRETLQALVSFNRDGGDPKAALEYAEQLVRISPGDSRLQMLVETLQRQINKPQAQ
jgi:predicted CXXCH cytochrome family protein